MPPPDATPEEIGEFWDTHSLADYWDKTHEVEFEVNLKSRQNPDTDAPAQKKDISMSDETKPDLSTNPDDTSNTALDVVTDLALDSTIPAPIRKNAFKAVDRLCSALIDVPVGALERRAAEKRAESEARIKIRDEITTQITQQIKVNPEYALRAGHKYAEKIIREQRNLDKISAIAAEELEKAIVMETTNRSTGEPNKEVSAETTNQGTDNNEEKTIDDDWLNNFENEARQVSTEEMQRRFGRILAGEIKKPGSYSIRTVKVLSQLDQDVAVLFKKLCSMSIAFEKRVGGYVLDARVPTLGRNVEQNALSKFGLDVEEINVLNESGLVISNQAPLYPYNLCIGIEGIPEPVPFTHQVRNWVLWPFSPLDVPGEFDLSGITFSTVGCELYHIVDQDPMPEYTEDLKKFLEEQKLQMVEVNRS